MDWGGRVLLPGLVCARALLKAPHSADSMEPDGREGGDREQSAREAAALLLTCGLD